MNFNIFIVSAIILFLNYIRAATSTLKSNDVRNYLGTRTPYRFRYNKNDSRIQYPNCKETKIWMITRHGTRLPSTKDIEGMKTILTDLKYEILLAHKQGKGELSKDQLQDLENWSCNLEEEEEKYLTKEGQDEMILLAERMQKRFPNIIKQKYDNQTFLFKYTATERAQQSARYFTIGLFDKRNAQEVIFAPTTRVDPLLRFYKHCDRWQKQVKKNPQTYKEQHAFGQSQVMNESLASISKKLGLDTLNLGEVNLMYKICGFETSWTKHNISPWCYGFDNESIQNLEYYHDLKHFWMDGYGYDLTYRQACLSIKNMFDSFLNDNGPNATFLFAHSGTLLKIIAHLQLYKSEPLRANELDKNRRWKTSIIDCFAANLAFVLFKCDGAGDHVLALHQEQIIKLPMCEEELCPLENLLAYFRDSIYNCNYSDMCNLSNEEISKR